MIYKEKLQNAEKLFLQGNIDTARKHFEQLLDEDPMDARVLNNLGVIAKTSDDAVLAEVFLSRAFANDPENIDVLLNLLGLFVELQKHASAVCLARFMYVQHASNREVTSAVEQAIEAILPHFLQHLIARQTGSFWHDRQALVEKSEYAALFDAALENPHDKRPRFILLQALFQVAVFDRIAEARAVLLSCNESGNLRHHCLALLAGLWLHSYRVYEAIFFAKQLQSLSPENDLAAAIIRAAKGLEKDPQVDKAYGRILVIMEEGIGNMVMLTPALQAIRQRFPACKLSVLGKKPAIETIKDLPFIDQTVTDWGEETYDLVLCSIWSQKALQELGEKFSRQSEFVFVAKLRPGMEHEAEANMKLAHFLGYNGVMPEPKVAKSKSPAALPEDRPIAILSNTTVNNDQWERKRWPYFAELAERLLKKGYAVVVVGGREEAQKFSGDYWPDKVIDLQGKLNLQETAAVIEKAELFVGNDSGPAHLAGALGIETYVFF